MKGKGGYTIGVAGELLKEPVLTGNARQNRLSELTGKNKKDLGGGGGNPPSPGLAACSRALPLPRRLRTSARDAHLLAGAVTCIRGSSLADACAEAGALNACRGLLPLPCLLGKPGLVMHGQRCTSLRVSETPRCAVIARNSAVVLVGRNSNSPTALVWILTNKCTTPFA